MPLRTPTIPPATHTNCYLLGSSAAVVVDPGSSYPAELRRLRRNLAGLQDRGGRVTAVVLTHHHGDHIGGAEIVARELDVPLWAHPWTLAAWSRRPDVEIAALDDGQRLEVGPGQEVEVLHTPGHAPGHLCFWDPRERVLVAGDMIATDSTIVIAPPEGDMALYLASLERLQALGRSLVLPGHGEPIGDGHRAFEKLRAHRLWREDRVLAALGSEPRALAVVTRAAYADVPPVSLPLASRSCLAHLQKLQAEDRADVEGERWAILSPPAR